MKEPLPLSMEKTSRFCRGWIAAKRPVPGPAWTLGAILLSAILLGACTGSPPEILEVQWEVRLEQDRDSGLLFESLSLFVKPNDPDGNEDLEEMYVIHDGEELFWRLDPDSWTQSGSGADLWIGSNSFRLPAGSPLPDGEYRILLRDLGGEAAERSIRVQAPSIAEARRYLPDVSIQQNQIRIVPRSREHVLWLYSLEGAFVGSVTVREGTQAIGTLRATYPALQTGFRFRVYSRIDAQDLGIVAGPYTVGS
jgi:hypothetical protein